MRHGVWIRHLKSSLLKIFAAASNDPLTNSALFGSTTTRTLLDSTRMSRLAGPSTRSILYCNPEQPPPITATLSAPCGRPCRCSNCESFAAALPVTFTKRSFPILYFTSLTGVTREYRICAAQKQTQASPQKSRKNRSDELIAG